MKLKRIIKKMLGEKGVFVLKKIKYFPINLLCSFFKFGKYIVFESNPDLACNSFEVYKYLLSKKINEKFQFIWLVNDLESYSNYSVKNVKFINKNPKKIKDKFFKYLYCNRAKVSFFSNCSLPVYKCSKKQLNIYLDHGSHLKNMKINGERCDISCGYIISQSEFFHKYIVEQYNLTYKQIICTGIPRNDQFYTSDFKLKNIYKDIEKFNKVISWVPTFRVSKSNRVDCDIIQPYDIPLIYNEKQIFDLNNILKDNNCLLIIKPHPAAKINKLNELNLSNLRVLNNEIMLLNNVQTNEFLKCTDAMITDYSGIYYDYLLLDKPIAITLDDFNEYKTQHGFVFDNPLDILVGDYLNNLDDLSEFIKNVCYGIDKKRVERNEIKKLTNEYFDGDSTKRLCEFVFNFLGEKNENI